MNFNGKRKFLPLLLALVLMLCLFTACTEEQTPTGGTTTGTTDTSGTTDTTETTDTTDTTDTTETTGTTGTTDTTESTDSSENVEPPVVEKDIKITVVNGTADGASETVYAEGDVATLTAATPANGYQFSFWENSKGEVVGTTATLEVTVTAEESYKAYYVVAFGENNTTPINTDLEKDWIQGATNGSFTGWSLNNTRVTFKTPYLLKKGETMYVDIPTAVCPQTPGDCPSISGTGDCSITAAFVIMTKNAGVETGDMTQDFSIKSGQWGKTTMTATEDTYVIVVIKWDKHGSSDFLLTNDWMKQVTVSVAQPSSDSAILLGAYWKAELEDTITKAESHRGEGVSEFFYLNDSHWPGNCGYSPALINYLAEKLESYFVHFNGDIIQRYNPVKQEAIDKEINGFYGALENYTKTGELLKIMTSLGNHDRNGSSNCPDPALRLTEQEAYDLYLKRMEGWGVTIAGNPNCSYYDDVDNKVRYIQFYFAGNKYGMKEDSYVEAAYVWAEEQIRALDADWTVVLFTHGFEPDTAKSQELAKRLLKLQGEAAAEIAIWLNGHYHNEQDEILYDDAGNKLRRVVINADALSYTAHFKMTAGTVTEQSFAFFQVDTKNEVIYLTRIGAGDDKVFTFGSKMEGGDVLYTDAKFVKVVNGLTSQGKSTIEIAANTNFTIIADAAPSGYAFSHWVNSAGETVGTTETLVVSVTKDDTFRAVYRDTDPSDDAPKATNQVLGGSPNEWQQGSYNGKFTQWDEGLRHTRITFTTPYELKAGETICVYKPASVNCPTDACENDSCSLVVAWIRLEKKAGSNTGDLFTDYEIKGYAWGDKYEATADCIVVAMVKYKSHGNITFTLSNAYMKEIYVTVTPKE